MHFSITELLLIAFIVLVLFGTKRLRNMGGDLGNALRDFKKALHEDPQAKPTADPAATAAQTDEPEKLADAQFHEGPAPQQPPRDSQDK